MSRISYAIGVDIPLTTVSLTEHTRRTSLSFPQRVLDLRAACLSDDTLSPFLQLQGTT